MSGRIDSRAVARAAALGLTLGVAACKNGGQTPSPEPAGSVKAATSAAPIAKADPSKACCRGLNECKGKGGCAISGKNECAGKNECKGKGGCNMHCPQ